MDLAATDELADKIKAGKSNLNMEIEFTQPIEMRFNDALWEPDLMVIKVLAKTCILAQKAEEIKMHCKS
jgi:hypothetical protein